MSILIDGYNLLHASGILGRGVGPGGLERSRTALLSFLAESLEVEEISQTVVVFDAGTPPHGLPRSLVHRGITVYFSSGHADADELIEELIQADNAPRRLTVVSSDHRIQRAARRRKATPMDSDKWYGSIVQRRIESLRRPGQGSQKPSPPATENEVNYWLRRFGVDPDQLAWKSFTDVFGQPPLEERKPHSALNPFPPGYAEDLLEDE